MERTFHRDLADLMTKVEDMAKLSRRSVAEGVEAFSRIDADQARRVMLLNKEINRADVAIETRALDLLALNQPMAKDLRSIGACLKIITYLDRIGRYGFDIAKATLHLAGRSHLPGLLGIPAMKDRALSMLDHSMTAFHENDAAKAHAVQAEDEDVDQMYDQVFADCTEQMKKPENAPLCVQYLLVARHLERVGDNSTKIAEKTIYMATGARRSTD